MRRITFCALAVTQSEHTRRLGRIEDGLQRLEGGQRNLEGGQRKLEGAVGRVEIGLQTILTLLRKDP